MAESPKISALCIKCNFKTDKEKDYLNHMKDHLYEADFRLKCVLCQKAYNSFRSYERHRKFCSLRVCVKKTNDKKVTNNETFWRCKIVLCNEEIPINPESNLKDFEKVKKHLYRHSRQGTKVTCPIPICGIAYDKYGSFSSHINWHILKNQFDLQYAPIFVDASLASEQSVDDSTIQGQLF